MHSVYFIPGMFGFGELAGYDYFHHLREGLEMRYRIRGVPVRFADVPTPPTSSIRERVLILANTVASCDSDGRGSIHLIGHSTGGIDARHALSPTVKLGVPREHMAWTRRVSTLVTMSSPHYGTPLASHFTTLSGARLLYAGSLLTIVALRLGEPWLALLSRLLLRFRDPERTSRTEREAMTEFANALLRFVDDDARRELKDFLRKITVDQGAIVQISPEAMDLSNTSIRNAEHVRYGCVVAAAPPPSTRRALRRVRTPYTAMTAALYGLMHRVTARQHARYPYGAPSPDVLSTLEAALNRAPTTADNDGVVPTLSMLWGDVLWAGEADHLDVIGHFRDDQVLGDHVDWLTSGSRFSRADFHSLVDAVAAHQLGETS